MKHKSNLESLPTQIQEHRYAVQAACLKVAGVERLKLFAEGWQREQEIWAELHPERAKIFEQELKYVLPKTKT